MRFNLRAKLIKVEDEEADGLYPKETVTGYSEVWCRKESVTYNEFYLAQQAGIALNFILCVRPEVYTEDVRYIELDGKKFKVIRAFLNKKNEMELSCGGIHNG